MTRKRGVDPSLVAFYKKVVDAVDESTTLDERLAILDRGIKIELLKVKIQDEEYGKDFDLGEADE